jgi:glycosyltransferase involved in cell wall biosynthesis
MSGPLVSVILPVYDGERFIAQALNSVFAQDHDDLDVIVVDDGSNDGTASVLARYQGRIRVIAQENAGPAAARNTGLAHARGDLLAFIDADDLWHPRKLELQLKELAAAPDADVSVCNVLNFWNGDPGEEREVLRAREYEIVNEGGIVQAVLVRRAVFDRIGGFDPRLGFGEDTDFYFRLDESGIKQRMLEQILGYRRIHAGNMTANWPVSKREILLDLCRTAIGRRRADGPLFPVDRRQEGQVAPGPQSGQKPDGSG